jgi:phytoene dehydrogenase-like protein
VIDRNANPGGTARGYHRKGFTFPCGPLGFSNPRVIAGAQVEGAGSDVPGFKRVDYETGAFGIRVPLSLPFEELARELAGLFPGEKAGVGGFFEDARVVVEAMRSTPEGEPPSLGELGRVSAAARLDGLVGDPRLRSLLGTMGTGEPRFGFAMLAQMWELMCNRGIWYPEGGFNGLSDGLAEQVKARGGEFKMLSWVTRIVVKEGEARGVAFADGTTIEAEAVISNADFKRTFLDLVEPEDQPPEWRGAVEAARETSSNFQVALGVEAGEVDLSPFAGASRIIYRRDGESAGPDWRSPVVDPEALAGQELEVALWSAEDPALAPPGGAVVVIRAAAEHAHFDSFRPGRAKRASGYAEYKARLAGAMVREVAGLLPGLERAARVTDVATPLTFEDRAGRHAGAVAGWSQLHEDVTDFTVRPLVLTPIKGLYMAGYQAFSWLYWGGVPSAVLSGARAATALLREEGPVAEVTIPGATGG